MANITFLLSNIKISLKETIKPRKINLKRIIKYWINLKKIHLLKTIKNKRQIKINKKIRIPHLLKIKKFWNYKKPIKKPSLKT